MKGNARCEPPSSPFIYSTATSSGCFLYCCSSRAASTFVWETIATADLLQEQHLPTHIRSTRSEQQKRQHIRLATDETRCMFSNSPSSDSTAESVAVSYPACVIFFLPKGITTCRTPSAHNVDGGLAVTTFMRDDHHG